MILDVRVIPNAGRSGITGARDGIWILRVTAPPVDGKANREAIRHLAKHFGVPTSRVHLRSGAKSRLKKFEIDL